MSELSEYISRLKTAKGQLKSDLERVAVKAVNDMLSLTINRVTQTGTASDGAAFTPYSTKQVGAWRYLGKSRTDSAEGKVRAKVKKKEPLSYAEFRRLNGLKTDKKIFEFTGEMWRQTGIVAVTSENGKVTVIVAGKNDLTNDKLAGHSNREGKDIVKPSAGETAEVRSYMTKWIIDAINKAK